MKARFFVLMLLITASAFAVAGCPATGDCPDCKKLEKALQARIFVSVDSLNHSAKATFYYENVSASPPRQPISNTTVILHVYNDTYKETYRIYTDANGTATFGFKELENASFNMKFLYCPFTNTVEGEEGYSKCGFLQCLDYGGIDCDVAPSCLPDAIPERLKTGESAPLPIRYYNLLPAIQTVTYNPPPKPLATVPMICLPALIIFALLGGALFLSGRNPFAGFDFSAPRMGRHIRYQARTISAGVTAPTPLVEAVKGTVAGALGGALGKLAGAIGGGGKVGKAMEKLSGKFIGGGAAVAVSKDGVRLAVGGGRGKSFKEQLKAGFIGGQVGTPWDKYKKIVSFATGLPSAMREAKASSMALKVMEKKPFLSFSKLTRYFQSLLNREAAVQAQAKSGGSKSSFDIKGVKDVKDANGNLIGVQLVDSKGKPLEFKIKGKKASVILDPSALREGKVGAITVFAGKNEFTIYEGEIVGVKKDGKALEGKALEAAVKSFDMKDFSAQFSAQLSKADIKMETRMFSKQFGGPVTLKYDPLSVGETGNFTITQPGKKGVTESVVSEFKGGKLDSITDLKGNKIPGIDTIPGTTIKIGDNICTAGLAPGEGIPILRQAYNASQSYNQVLEAERNLQQATVGLQTEEYVHHLKEGAKEKAAKLGLTGNARDFVVNANHSRIASNATNEAQTSAQSAGLAALGKEGMNAYKKYMDERSLPGASERRAWETHVEPVIKRNRDKFEVPYTKQYIDTYKAEITKGYMDDAKFQAMTSGKTLTQADRQQISSKIGSNPDKVAGEFKGWGSALPTNATLADVDKPEVRASIGPAIQGAAENYMKNRVKPPDLPPAAIFWYKASQQFATGSGASGGMDTRAFQKSKTTEYLRTLTINTPGLPKEMQDAVYNTALYNLPQAVKQLRAGGYKGGDTEEDRRLEEASVREAIRRQQKKREEESRIESLERAKKKAKPA